MIWDAIDFICRETVLQLKRERLIALATVSTVALVLVMTGALALLLINLRLWTERLSAELVVHAYFAPDRSREEVEAAVHDIATWADVQSAVLVTKEQAWRWLQENLSSSDLLRGMDNPLPDGVRVQVRNPSHIADVARRLAEVPGVNDVVPSAGEASGERGFVKTVIRARRAVTLGGAIAYVLLAGVAIFIVHNTIRLALHTRWREIYVMQLVGATRGLIAGPFLLEGIVHGTLGAALACCVLVPAHMYLRSLTARAAPFFLLAPDRALLPFALYLLAAGAVLGLLGSGVSVRRFLSHRPEWLG